MFTLAPPPALDSKEKLRRLARGARGGVVSTDRASALLGLPHDVAAQTLRRLSRRGWLARVRRGLYVILPLEAGSGGGVVEDPLLLARELYEPCYIGGWTAAEHWGLTEQLFRSTFVVTAANVREAKAEYLGSEFHIVRARAKRVASVSPIWRGSERVALSDRERTIADALASPGWVGGVRHLAACLRAYRQSKDWDPKRLVAQAVETGSGAAIKRLGFLTEKLLGGEGEVVRACFDRRTTGNVRLDPSVPTRGRLSSRWRLWINVHVADEAEGS